MSKRDRYIRLYEPIDAGLFHGDARRFAFSFLASLDPAQTFLQVTDSLPQGVSDCPVLKRRADSLGYRFPQICCAVERVMQGAFVYVRLSLEDSAAQFRKFVGFKLDNVILTQSCLRFPRVA
jgi:hypothetical protein